MARRGRQDLNDPVTILDIEDSKDGYRGKQQQLS
jgi:hypothetical protein